MFPSPKTRFASAARRGFDLAVEFATLGEYVLAPADEVRGARDATGPAPLVRSGSIRPRPTRVKPATPAARRLQPAQQQRPIPARSGVRALALGRSGLQPPPRAARKRAGAAPPRPQRCLVAEAGGRQP